MCLARIRCNMAIMYNCKMGSGSFQYWPSEIMCISWFKKQYGSTIFGPENLMIIITLSSKRAGALFRDIKAKCCVICNIYNIYIATTLCFISFNTSSFAIWRKSNKYSGKGTVFYEHPLVIGNHGLILTFPSWRNHTSYIFFKRKLLKRHSAIQTRVSTGCYRKSKHDIGKGSLVGGGYRH